MREEASLKAGNYAVLDTAGGWRVLCRSRLSAERYCTYELATIETVTCAGSRYRVPKFGHRSWLLRNGVWRVPAADRQRIRQGLRPRAMAWTGPWREGPGGREQLLSPWVPELPTTMRCPLCDHRRVLDAVLLDVLSGEEANVLVAQDLAARYPDALAGGPTT